MRLHVSKKNAAIAATAVLVAAASVTAFAYWTGAGSGTGTFTNSGTTASVVVTQTQSTGNLAPGGSVALSGVLTNPSATDIKVGILTAKITEVSEVGVLSDLTIAGNGVPINAVVPGNGSISWSGMTLNYANSTVNQDTGKKATITIAYALSVGTEQKGN